MEILSTILMQIPPLLFRNKPEGDDTGPSLGTAAIMLYGEVIAFDGDALV